ncbi:hypothetical protein [Aeoliella mucimassa]|uniref:Uncharacterized protein n=1 Tax=Aeoliella mucimassa TaxID=2527972 RepID=A0A518AHN6_9BACT|nr:hypothetical protein [Aeoliella mucimassa]QDU54248.1 hypothetical protein Pan181_04280 [Aeoliella mucimassa]
MSLVRHRRFIAALLLTAFAVAAVGVPLDLPRIAKRTIERYPCENCSCGCDSALVCWTNCCCHTLAERLAWARNEGVRPPEFALALAREQRLNVAPWIEEPTVCESTTSSPETCATSTKSSKPCCCCCQSAETAATEEVADAAEPCSRTSAWQAATCGGTLKWWLCMLKTTPPEIQIAWPAASPERLVPLAGSLCSSMSYEPATPPPQHIS